ncbi:MAG: hypothetical protein IKW88_07480 [Clostridiales bacterium]|nr:hypothetical protein [Clostridiales bacterium]
MKKFIATVLSAAIVMSLAACSGKQQEQTVPESSETTTQVTETTETTKAAETTEATTAAETTTTAATTAPVLTKKDYVKNARSKYKSYVNGDKDKEFYAPEILIKSDYADQINKEIENLFKGYKKDMKKGDPGIYGTEYMTHLTKEGILTVVIREVRTYDTYHVYNIDVTTGKKVDNARMAEIAGFKDIKKAAKDTLQNYYLNTNDGIPFKNYKVVKKKGKKLTNGEKKAEASFGEKYINDNIAAGLTDKGKLFFVLTVWGGSRYEQEIYGFDDDCIWYEGNPAITAPKNNWG